MNESVLLCIIKPRAAENFLGFDVLRAVSEGTFDKITQPPLKKLAPPFWVSPPNFENSASPSRKANLEKLASPLYPGGRNNEQSLRVFSIEGAIYEITQK